MSEITTEQMSELLDNFMGVHHEGVKDDIGPNAADANFFSTLHSTLNETMYAEAASRLQTYRNTQLPQLLMSIGVDPTEGQAFLDGLTKQGEEAVEYMSIHKSMTSSMERLAMRQARDGIDVDEVRKYTDVWGDLQQELFGHVAHERGLADVPEDVFEFYATMYDRFLTEKKEADASRQAARKARLTIKAEVYEDTWYGRNDINKRYPKTSKRILMRFPYDEKLIPALKAGLVGQGRCIWKPEFKAWSLKMEAALIDKACAIFTGCGYLPEQLAALKSQCVTTTKKQSTACEATIEGDALVLKWPWLNDDDLRGQVMAIVKGVMGRKWNGQRKVWTVPVAQAAFVKGRLDKVYPELANAIGALSQLDDIISNTAERIAISSAATLHDDERIDEMRERLAEVFPKGKELYPFQYVGVRFAELANGKALIGDDMGVGKTIQALAYTALHPEHHPVLVVCPANVKFNWLKEAKAWLPTYETDVIRTGKDDIPDADIVVINYDLMSRQRDNLLAHGFNTVIFDESHYLKNYKAQRTDASLTVAKNAKSVLSLSGTAITNRPNEFFTTLNMLRPEEFSSFFTYAKRYCDGYHNGFGWDFSGSSNEAELHERTRTVAIRRLKKEVMDDLPDKIRQVVDVVPAKAEMKEYSEAAKTWAMQYEMHLANNSLPAGFVLNMLTDLRHRAGRMKVGATARHAMDYHKTTGKPLIIFTHHRDVQEMLTEAIGEEYRKFTKDDKAQFGMLTLDYINGSVSPEHRQRAVERFQNGDVTFLVCSTIAAKEGLTLTAADTVMFVEREWVPGWEEQAEDRVNRIGQDAETVHALYLSVTGTIDEKFNAVVEEKRATVAAILDGGEVGKRDGIAKALLRAMVDDGQLPASMLDNMGVKA